MAEKSGHIEQIGGLPLRSQGALAFVDTGAPPGVDSYTTLVIIPWICMAFRLTTSFDFIPPSNLDLRTNLHSTPLLLAGVFAPFLPLHKAHKCRIVLINRTDYPGSKALGPDDLQLLDRNQSDPIAAYKEFFKRRASEIVEFLAWFVKEHGIAQITEVDGKKEGGLILTTWSWGNFLIVAILAYLDEFDATAVQALKPYFRKFQIYDPPHHLFGFPEHPNAYNPLSVDADAEEAAKIFLSFVSAYWQHPSLSLSSFPSDPTQPTFQFKTPPTDPPPTILTMSEAEIASGTSPGSVGPDNADAVMYHAASGWNKTAFARMRERAFAEDHATKAGAGLWEGAETVYIWCPHTIWEGPWAVWNMQKMLREAREEGEWVRDVRMVKIDGANHFYHWSYPEEALRILIGA